MFFRARQFPNKTLLTPQSTYSPQARAYDSRSSESGDDDDSWKLKVKDFDWSRKSRKRRALKKKVDKRTLTIIFKGEFA